MNLPKLPAMKNVLYLGIGGGYDIYGAIPIYESLPDNVGTFANISNEVTTINARYVPFFPLNPQKGVVGLTDDLDRIIVARSIDTIIAVDGGVDCLMQGNEENSGTVLQDFITLAAMKNVHHQVNKVVVCVGLGCEHEENMNNYAVLQNISRLIQCYGFYGTCSLITNTDPYFYYKASLDEAQRKSHIQTRVLAAVEGRFGELDLVTDANMSQILLEEPSAPTINPLMNIFWFFDFQAVVANNRVLSVLDGTKSVSEALMAYRKVVTRTRLMRPFTL